MFFLNSNKISNNIMTGYYSFLSNDASNLGFELKELLVVLNKHTISQNSHGVMEFTPKICSGIEKPSNAITAHIVWVFCTFTKENFSNFVSDLNITLRIFVISCHNLTFLIIEINIFHRLHQKNL